MSGQLNTQEGPSLKGFLEKHSSVIKEVAVGTLTSERMTRLVCAAASRDPKLAECTPLSVLRSMVQCASMGLEPFDGRSLVHIIPRWNGKAKAVEATVLVDFRGLIYLATLDGRVRNIEARVVYEKDEFGVEYGDSPKITHKPSWAKDRGEIVAFYAVAFMPDGSTTFDVMPLHEVEAIRDRSKDKDGFSPWKTDFVEMGRKTAVRRLSKYLPKSMPLAKALEIQAKTEAGDYHEVADAEVLRPGDAPAELGTTMTQDGDGNTVFEWSEEETLNLRASLDVLLDLGERSGETFEEAEARCNTYNAQMNSGEEPRKVMNRVATQIQNLESKIKKAAVA